MSGAGSTFLVIVLSVTVIGQQIVNSSSSSPSSPASASTLPSPSSSSASSSTVTADTHSSPSSGSSTASTSTHKLPTAASPASTSKSSSSESAGSKIPAEFAGKVEAGLMKMLGLRTRPRPAATAGGAASSSQAHIPQYLLNLYNSHVHHDDRNSGNFHIKDLDTFSANTIRSFHHQDNLASDDTLQAGEEEASHKVHCRFNVSSITEEETVTAGELRIFRHPDLTHDGKYRLDVHEILYPASDDGGEAITRLIDTKIVDPRQSAWESFDVRPAVHRWKQSPHLNHGLEVHVTSTRTRKPPTSHSVRLRRSAEMDDDSWKAVQPLLITYSDDGKTSHLRTKRASNRKRNKNRRKSNDEADRRSKNSRRRNSRRRKRREECQRHPLYVDFSDVGWNDWIVAPPGYKAYYCQGECDFPLQDYLNATNHAIVQTLVHSVSPTSAPKPCCVPTELEPISMLYIDEGRAVLKSYQQMVVVGCGCR